MTQFVDCLESTNVHTFHARGSKVPSGYPFSTNPLFGDYNDKTPIKINSPFLQHLYTPTGDLR